MTTYTLRIENREAERAIAKTLTQLKKNPTISLAKKGSVISIKTKKKKENMQKSKDSLLNTKMKGKKTQIIRGNDEDNMMLPGKPMTWEQLKKEAQEGLEQYKRGEYYTTEQLLEDMKKW